MVLRLKAHRYSCFVSPHMHDARELRGSPFPRLPLHQGNQPIVDIYVLWSLICYNLNDSSKTDVNYRQEAPYQSLTISVSEKM